LSRGIFAPEFVRRLVSLHQAGEDHSERLWALVNFEMWQRRFFDSEAPPAAEPILEKSLVGV
jgi:asparagine synthase (glutamine-hydrolysing)